MTAGTTVQAPDGTQVVLGEIGQKMLLENDRVRLWEVALAPGETQPWHLHHNPYLVVNIQASPCRMDWLDGAPPRYVSEYVGGIVYQNVSRSEEHTSELQSRENLVCRLLLEKKKAQSE